MHRYIDKSILWDFRKDIDLDTVRNDLHKYGIHGYYKDTEDDFFTSEDLIAYALYNDYILHVSNYRVYIYIEHGLSVRMLMELRLSSLFTYCGKLSTFWDEHKNLDTPQQVIDLRIKYGRLYLNADYANLGYQNYFIIRIMWGIKAKQLETDYEPCYEDRRWNVSKTPRQYKDDWLMATRPPLNPDGSFNWGAKIVGDNFYEYECRDKVIDVE